jgi:predicted dehydrogenase
MELPLMFENELGVAVIGLGVGEQHASAFADAHYCTVYWVYDLDVSRTRKVTDKLSTAAVADGYETILADESVDIISIASYDDAHFAQVVAALEAGKHVFVEKPLCRSHEELRTIKQTWFANGCRYLTSNLVLRAAPVYRWLKNAINTGELGEIYAFDGDYLYGRIHKITEGWRNNVGDYSVMLGGGVHLVDLMLWLTNQRPVSVTTLGNRISTIATDFRYDDFMTAAFQFPSGLIGRVSANFGCVHRHQHVVRVFGTKSTFICDDQGPRLYTNRDPAVHATPINLPTLPASKGALIPDFIQAIIGDKNKSVPAQHEFDVISVCVASDQALAAGRNLDIEYV